MLNLGMLRNFFLLGMLAFNFIHALVRLRHANEGFYLRRAELTFSFEQGPSCEFARINGTVNRIPFGFLQQSQNEVAILFRTCLPPSGFSRGRRMPI